MRREVSCVRRGSVPLRRIRNPGASPATGWLDRKVRETGLDVGSASRRRKSGHRIRASAKMKCCAESRQAAVKEDFFEPPQHGSERNMSGPLLRRRPLHRRAILRPRQRRDPAGSVRGSEGECPTDGGTHGGFAQRGGGNAPGPDGDHHRDRGFAPAAAARLGVRMLWRGICCGEGSTTCFHLNSSGCGQHFLACVA